MRIRVATQSDEFIPKNKPLCLKDVLMKHSVVPRGTSFHHAVELLPGRPQTSKMLHAALLLLMLEARKHGDHQPEAHPEIFNDPPKRRPISIFWPEADIAKLL
jgi:hypothetical protein